MRRLPAGRERAARPARRSGRDWAARSARRCARRTPWPAARPHAGARPIARSQPWRGASHRPSTRVPRCGARGAAHRSGVRPSAAAERSRYEARRRPGGDRRGARSSPRRRRPRALLGRRLHRAATRPDRRSRRWTGDRRAGASSPTGQWPTSRRGWPRCRAHQVVAARRPRGRRLRLRAARRRSWPRQHRANSTGPGPEGAA